MKKFLISIVSFICILSLLSLMCFATDTTIESEITISPLVDNTISKIHYHFFNIEKSNDIVSDYQKLLNGLYGFGAISTSTAIGSCYCKCANLSTYHNYPIYESSINSYYRCLIANTSLSLAEAVIDYIYEFDLTIINSQSNQSIINDFNQITNKIVTYEYSNVINSGFQNSLKILGYSLKTFLQNQYIKLAIGLACGTFFVSFAIFKTKSLIKGY